MTRTARALVIGLLVVLLALSVTAVGAAQDESAPGVASPSESHLLDGARASAATVWPALTEILAPLALAALCGTALALFSGPHESIRVRVKRRK